MGRKAKGRPTAADYTVWTSDLNQAELMIILNASRIIESTGLKENFNFCERNATSTEGIAG